MRGTVNRHGKRVSAEKGTNSVRRKLKLNFPTKRALIKQKNITAAVNVG